MKLEQKQKERIRKEFNSMCLAQQLLVDEIISFSVLEGMEIQTQELIKTSQGKHSRNSTATHEEGIRRVKRRFGLID